MTEEALDPDTCCGGKEVTGIMPERTKPDFGGESDKAWYELDRRDSLRVFTKAKRLLKDCLTALLAVWPISGKSSSVFVIWPNPFDEQNS